MSHAVIEDLRFMTRAADRLRLAGLDLLAELNTARTAALAAEQDRLSGRGEAERADEMQERAEASEHLNASIRNEILRYEGAISLAEVDFSVRSVVHGGLVEESGRSVGPGFTVRAHDHYQGFHLGSAVSDERGHYYIDFVPGQDGTSQTGASKETGDETVAAEDDAGGATALASSYVDLTVFDTGGNQVLGPTSASSFSVGHCREKRLILPISSM